MTAHIVKPVALVLLVPHPYSPCRKLTDKYSNRNIQLLLGLLEHPLHITLLGHIPLYRPQSSSLPRFHTLRIGFQGRFGASVVSADDGAMAEEFLDGCEAYSACCACDEDVDVAEVEVHDELR
jgi:hypothetical protein